MAVLHALRKWKIKFKGVKLIIHKDNTGVVNGLKNLLIKKLALKLLCNAVIILALQDIVIELHWLSLKKCICRYIIMQAVSKAG